jgi:fructose-bisphosphate aldolase class II
MEKYATIYGFSFAQEHNEPLFSSHMLDLSEEFDEENIATCVKYFKRMAPMKMWLEMEIGITGGEEDGVDNSNVKADALYTKPDQVFLILIENCENIYQMKCLSCSI